MPSPATPSTFRSTTSPKGSTLPSSSPGNLSLPGRSSRTNLVVLQYRDPARKRPGRRQRKLEMPWHLGPDRQPLAYSNRVHEKMILVDKVFSDQPRYEPGAAIYQDILPGLLLQG